MPIPEIKQNNTLILLALGVFFILFPGSLFAAEQERQAEAKFDLLELRVKGNTLLERTLLERTIYPFLGPGKSIEAVENARNALEEVYRKKGYQTVAVDIPEQHVEQGVVYLQVVEGRISRLRVKGSRYFSLGNIKAGLPELAEGNVPNLPVMQQQLADLSGQSADRIVTPIMRAGETPGTVEVDLKVKDKLPLHGRLELNGRNVKDTSRLRLISTLRYDNLWQKLHSASLMYQVSPENSAEVDVWAVTYAMPIPSTDAKLAFYGVRSSSDAAIARAGAINIIGRGEIYGLRLIKPLPSLERYFHSMTAGIDYKNFTEDLNLVGNPAISTPIEYIPFSMQYNSSLRGKESLTSFNLGANFAVRGLGNEPGEFENKRADARPNYFFLTSGLNFEQDLPEDFQFASRLTAQAADTPLINNEQFSLGGMQSVRGYFETQALSDSAFTGTLELRSPRLVPVNVEYVNKLQAVAFVDGGYGWNRRVLPGNPETYDLASAGLGLRFQLWEYFQGVLDLGFPLISLGAVKSGDPKFHFIVATEF